MAQRCQLRVRPFLGHVTVATISCWPDPMPLAMSFLGHPGNPNCPVSASTWPFDELELQRTAMDSEVRTVVTFESTAFNLAEPKNCFINPCCFGDDLARWLIGELRKHGLETDDEPSQEDFGWYLNFETACVAHTFVIGHRPTGETEAGTWFGVIERNRGFFRKREIQRSAVEAIHGILSTSPLIQDVRWHFKLDFGKGTSSPQTNS